MCDVGYLCANFGLPRPLCSRLRPDVRESRQTDVRRQTNVRQHHRFMPPPRERGIIIHLVHMGIVYMHKVGQHKIHII